MRETLFFFGWCGCKYLGMDVEGRRGRKEVQINQGDSLYLHRGSKRTYLRSWLPVRPASGSFLPTVDGHHTSTLVGTRPTSEVC